MAARFWVGGGSSANWNATGPTNWSSTSGGANDQTVPGGTDTVTFDGAGANGNTACTVSVSTGNILSLTFTSGYTNTITQNTGVILSIAGNFTDNTAHGWTVNGTASLAMTGNGTIASGGKTYPGPVAFNKSSLVVTLNGNWTISGALTISIAATLNWTTNETLSCAGLTATASLSGTAKLVLTGGTWSGGGITSNSLDIAGNVTISGAIVYSTNTLTYVSGTVTTTSSSLTISGNAILNTAGIIFNNITAANCTLSSLLTATGTMSTAGGVTFLGTGGFTVGTFSCTSTGAATISLNDAAPYTVTTALNAGTSRVGAIVHFTSDDATNRVALTVAHGATCNLLASFTRVNASGGRTLATFNGVVTDCINVVTYSDILWKPNRGFDRGARKLERSTRNRAVEYL